MKKSLVFIGKCAMIIALVNGCKKDSQPDSINPAYTSAQNNLSPNYNYAKKYNDSITYYHKFDTTMLSDKCFYYDKLYHHNDSSFSKYYNICLQMISNGTMMTGNNGMMGGSGQGMMGGAGQGMMSDPICKKQSENISQMQDQMTTIREIHKKFHTQ